MHANDKLQDARAHHSTCGFEFLASFMKGVWRAFSMQVQFCSCILFFQLETCCHMVMCVLLTLLLLCRFCGSRCC